MATDSLDLTFIGRQLQSLQSQVSGLNQEVSEIRRGFLMITEKLTRTDRHISEVKDDVELLLKSEIMGSITHLETKIETRLEEHTTRIESKIEQLMQAIAK